MTDNNSLGNKSRKKLLQKARVSSPPPIVLVPETPPPIGEIPIATEDEATPTPAAPPSPSSYASVAALPAARSNVVVWPRNPAVVDPVSYTPPLGQSELKGDDTTPVIGDQGGGTSVASSSLPSSSPIHFTSSDTSSPTLPTATSVAHSTPIAFGATASSAGESYESFWEQVRTPLLSEANMPSALQTPRVLSPMTTRNPPDILWPTTAPASRIADGAGLTGDENRPPTLEVDGSHPPQRQASTIASTSRAPIQRRTD
ncbi:hypothetical protein OH76DRAFT_1486089 [Lentinus brumalis]|uniref:Uncharacterized protein n=1 Tax=Lentinus brumalis TaxID=2498619 RepID=A0A371CZR8_9APHY|nr:hypothetical protein OH76DRAFT_1486089 [Polyporus brumalis]